MKTFRLFMALLLAGAAMAPAAAQRHPYRHADQEYDPTVYLISVHEIDTFMMDCDARQRAALMNRMATASAVNDYRETFRPGFQQVQQPQFIFATKDNRFSLALGGSIAFRAGYDFLGTVDNLDFVPYDIPMQESYNTSQKLMMDATTSRLFLKAISNTRYGRVVVFVDTDFRGGAAGSYTPRLRSAYASFAGFTIGRDVTTFCDLQAAPRTIDYRGPNAYNFFFNTLLRYEHTFWNDCVTFGLAAEMPHVNATYGSNFAPLQQRMPDFPAYLQVAWGRNRRSHLRASAVLRNMYAYDLSRQHNTSYFGWGVQGSGHIALGRPLELFFSGVYGEGISPYIQDLRGAALDFIPKPDAPGSMTTVPVYGVQAAAQINLMPNRLSLSGGYSMVRVRRANGILSDAEYREGQYIFGNLFWNITRRFTMAFEYLYGTRENMGGQRNHANRANMMMQYNF